ncbi:hypothetical protein JMUB5695_00829 [Mycobacterium heckeshornense]|nr:hypothetical protein JMUB5695_00829 [Mycobacterium heckeshornense]
MTVKFGNVEGGGRREHALSAVTSTSSAQSTVVTTAIPIAVTAPMSHRRPHPLPMTQTWRGDELARGGRSA